MVALLTSSQARSQKSLTPSQLITPPILPPQADPNSEDARLLGPFSKRREVNIRWRYFTREWKKVYPPLQIRLAEWRESGETRYMVDEDSLLRAGIRGAPMQNTGIMEQVIALAGQAHELRSSTRRERLAGQAHAHGSSTRDEPFASDDLTDALPSGFDTHLPHRFLRRRFRTLLSRLPILTYTYEKSSARETRPKYEVSLASAAVSQQSRYMPSRFVEADETDIAWIQHAEKEDAEEEALRKEAHTLEKVHRTTLIKEARANKLRRESISNVKSGISIIIFIGCVFQLKSVQIDNIHAIVAISCLCSSGLAPIRVHAALQVEHSLVLVEVEFLFMTDAGKHILPQEGKRQNKKKNYYALTAGDMKNKS